MGQPSRVLQRETHDTAVQQSTPEECLAGAPTAIVTSAPDASMGPLSPLRARWRRVEAHAAPTFAVSSLQRVSSIPTRPPRCPPPQKSAGSAYVIPQIPRHPRRVYCTYSAAHAYRTVEPAVSDQRSRPAKAVTRTLTTGVFLRGKTRSWENQTGTYDDQSYA